MELSKKEKIVNMLREIKGDYGVSYGLSLKFKVDDGSYEQIVFLCVGGDYQAFVSMGEAGLLNGCDLDTAIIVAQEYMLDGIIPDYTIF